MEGIQLISIQEAKHDMECSGTDRCVSSRRKQSKMVEPHHKVQTEILTGEEDGKEESTDT